MWRHFYLFFPLLVILLFSLVPMALSCVTLDTHSPTQTHSLICLYFYLLHFCSLTLNCSCLFLPLSSPLLFPFLWNLKISHPDCVLYILLPWWLLCRTSKRSLFVLCMSVCVLWTHAWCVFTCQYPCYQPSAETKTIFQGCKNKENINYH